MQAARPTVRTNAGTITRAGKGYSLEELQEAGLNPRTARSRNIPVDSRRSTKYPENIEQLRSVAQVEKSKPAPKKQEADLVEEKQAKKPAAKKKAKKGKRK